MEEQELKEMKLHETLSVDNKTEIQKVIGGWVYRTYTINHRGDNIGIATTFVPDNTAIYDLISEIQSTVQFIRNKF